MPVNGLHSSSSEDILTSPVEGQGFVSIDGKRTYLNLFESTESIATPSKIHREEVRPTRTQQVVGTSHPTSPGHHHSPRPSPTAHGHRRPTFSRRPSHPPVRIDTCIVGDSSTCDVSQHEACATVHGVSACHCKPGFARHTHTLPCKSTLSIAIFLNLLYYYSKLTLFF